MASAASGDILTLLPGLHSGNSGPSGLELDAKAFTIRSQNDDPTATIVDFAGNPGITTNADLTIRGVAFVNGDRVAAAATTGGCIVSSSSNTELNITNSHFNSCHAQRGGAVDSEGNLNVYFADIVASDCSATVGTGGFAHVSLSGTPNWLFERITIDNCTAAEQGGGMYINPVGYVAGVSSVARQIKATNCMAGAVTSTSCGGGIHTDETDVFDSEFSGNVAGCGAGLVLSQGFSGSNLYVHDNQARFDGGGVHINGNGELSNSLFLDNVAGTSAGSGGALDILTGPITLTNVTARRNYGSREGGAIYSRCPTTLVGCTFEQNGATRRTGGVYCSAGCNLLSLADTTNPTIIRNNVVGESELGDHHNMDCNGCTGSFWNCKDCLYGRCDWSGNVGSESCVCDPFVGGDPTTRPCGKCISAGMGYNDESSSCELCLQDHYSAPGDDGMDRCFACPAGTTQPEIGAVGVDSCTGTPADIPSELAGIRAQNDAILAELATFTPPVALGPNGVCVGATCYCSQGFTLSDDGTTCDVSAAAADTSGTGIPPSIIAGGLGLAIGLCAAVILPRFASGSDGPSRGVVSSASSSPKTTA